METILLLIEMLGETYSYSHNYNIISSLPGQPFRESGQQIGLHLFWSEVSGLRRKRHPFTGIR